MSKIQEYQQRYLNAAHAMQTGVATVLGYNGSSATPKHLRVGVNSAMVETSTLAQLLMEKGVFTDEEYFQKLALTMEAEVTKYQDEIKNHTGTEVDIKLL
jgi:DNA polymerase I-like protein with 3'-5' exonuclease and polymerase domains